MPSNKDRNELDEILLPVKAEDMPHILLTRKKIFTRIQTSIRH